ncbi:PepSY-like domain-containing protein [Sphingobacterium siyangense]|uniref:Putative PepSY-like beta-lactamase-inhibitor n=1 Tax=Sphingobacterium siyangense TaxID=459529 RepID=A0A562M797_9SPHI|nr:PepSY-like domain-containing protein [Sphingobacterium siyangense]TWI15805.1 putative PepSY-like beta-lactamase-inhibitor [Sphingobacterium siyangense]
MKRLIFILALMVSVSLVKAQEVSEKKVPSVIKLAFQQKYPNVKSVKWEKEKGNYEAGFKVGKINYSVLINAAGHIIETEVGIPVGELPADAKAYIIKNYSHKNIKEAAKITDARNNVSSEAEVDGRDLIFDDKGKFLKEVRD